MVMKNFSHACKALTVGFTALALTVGLFAAVSPASNGFQLTAVSGSLEPQGWRARTRYAFTSGYAPTIVGLQPELPVHVPRAISAARIDVKQKD